MRRRDKTESLLFILFGRFCFQRLPFRFIFNVESAIKFTSSVYIIKVNCFFFVFFFLLSTEILLSTF